MKNIAQIASISVLEFDKKIAVKFISQSASLYIDEKSTSQGRLKEYALKFKIAGISASTAYVVKLIVCCKVIEVVDINGVTTVIGSDQLCYKSKIRAVNAGVAGGFRGYEIEVDWSNS